MLVHDVADQLLDQVLDGDKAVRATELVDDDRHLQPAAAQRFQQWVEFDRGRYAQMSDHHITGGHGIPIVLGNGNRMLHMDQTDHVVEVLTDDRET